MFHPFRSVVAPVCIALAAASAAHANPVQLDLTFADLDFAFYVSAPWMDPADSGHYDAAATSTELKSQFENGLAFGGATWDASDRAWRLAQSNNPFTSVTFSLVFDLDDFALGHVIGSVGTPVIQGSYGAGIGVTMKTGGSVTGSDTIGTSFVTASGDGVTLYDTFTTDAVAFLASEGAANLDLVFGQLGGATDWFDAVTGGNALTYALETAAVGGYLTYFETIFSTAMDELGEYEVTGSLVGYSLSAAPTGGGTGGTPSTPVPLPLPAMMLVTGLGGLVVLRRNPR